MATRLPSGDITGAEIPPVRRQSGCARSTGEIQQPHIHRVGRRVAPLERRPPRLAVDRKPWWMAWRPAVASLRPARSNQVSWVMGVELPLQQAAVPAPDTENGNGMGSRSRHPRRRQAAVALRELAPIDIESLGKQRTLPREEQIPSAKATGELSAEIRRASRESSEPT